MARILKIFVALLFVAGIALGGFAWMQNREGDGNGLIYVEIERGAIVEKAVAVGQIEPRVKFHVKSKLPGIVMRCAVHRHSGFRVRALRACLLCSALDKAIHRLDDHGALPEWTRGRTVEVRPARLHRYSR